jgi:hypothetical protein
VGEVQLHNSKFLNYSQVNLNIRVFRFSVFQDYEDTKFDSNTWAYNLMSSDFYC